MEIMFELSHRSNGAEQRHANKDGVQLTYVSPQRKNITRNVVKNYASRLLWCC